MVMDYEVIDMNKKFNIFNLVYGMTGLMSILLVRDNGELLTTKLFSTNIQDKLVSMIMFKGTDIIIVVVMLLSLRLVELETRNMVSVQESVERIKKILEVDDVKITQ
jgi:hypothetical protein